MIKIYRLSRLGQMVAHSIRARSTPEWAVIYYLSRVHVASEDKILHEVSGVTSGVLTAMRRKRLLVEETGVNV